MDNCGDSEDRLLVPLPGMGSIFNDKRGDDLKRGNGWSSGITLREAGAEKEKKRRE